MSWNWEDIQSGVIEWMNTVRYDEEGKFGKWKYNNHMLRSYAVESSAIAIQLLEKLQYTKTLTPSLREQAVATLQSWQNAETGLYHDPLIKPGDKVLDVHSWEHIWNHHTLACVPALKILGARPLYPVSTGIFTDLGTVDPVEWTLSLNWTNPWLVGEHWGAVVRNYRIKHKLTENKTDLVLEAFYRTFEEKIMNPANGMPDRQGCDNMTNLFTGLFKVGVLAYEPFDRPFPYVEQAIDTLLSIQKESGEFDKGGMCLNMDALWDFNWLAGLTKRQYRFDEMIESGRKLCDFLYNVHRKSDGGFSFDRDFCWDIHNSILISERLPEGDMVGTSMSVDCYRFIDHWERGEIVGAYFKEDM